MKDKSTKPDHGVGVTKYKNMLIPAHKIKRLMKNPPILESEDFEMFELETSVFISAALSRRESLVQLDDGANNRLLNDKLRTVASV
jgi:hypothetical protein